MNPWIFRGLIMTGISLFIATVWLPVQPIDRLTDDRFEEKDGTLLLEGRPYSGTTVEHFPNRLLYQEIHYKSGLKNGESLEYANNGRLRYRWNYKAGQKHGLQEGWFIEGPKRFEQNFRNGILEGVQTEWHLNGTIFNQQTFADGVETQRKVLYPTSEVFSNYVKNAGRTFGIDGGALCFEVKREGER